MRRLNEVRSNLLDLGIKVTSSRMAHSGRSPSKGTENIVNIVNIVNGNQGVAADDMPDDMFLRSPISSVLQKTLTIGDGTDDTGDGV